MLDVLARAIEALPRLLADPTEAWHSLDVDYEPPRVERLWRPFEDCRLMLHRIHPCDSALYHPHPWPSAVKVVSGRYAMDIGADDMTAGTIILTAGSSYEMVHQNGWHSVRPLGEPSLSIMITGKPYEVQFHDHGRFGGDAKLGPLSEDAAKDLLWAFRRAVWGDEMWPEATN